MNDNPTTRIPLLRQDGDGPWQRPAEADAPAPAPDGGAHRRLTRRHGAAPARSRTIAISAAAALVVAGIAGYTLSGANSAGRDATRVTAAGDVPAPSAPALAPPSATVSASASASPSPSASVSASPRSSASASASPSAHKTASQTPATRPAKTKAASPADGPVGPDPKIPGARTTSQSTSDAEAMSLQLLNAERATVGLPPLTLRADLSGFARKWAQHMSTTGFGHSSDSDTHYLVTGSRTWIGENIVWWSNESMTAQEAAEKFQAMWRHSSGHYKAQTSSSFTEVGVGIYHDGTGWWGVHNFSDAH
ncbi:CAP domain-containing protein [Streptomyces sp. NPDC055103]